MKSFGSCLEDCRLSVIPKITHEDIAGLFPKDISTISRWESDNEFQKRKVGFPTIREKDLMKDYFQKRGVPDNLISNFDFTWKEEMKKRLGINILPEDQLYATDIMIDINSLSSRLSRIVKSDISARVNRAIRFSETKKKFDAGKSKFIDTNEQYTNLINDAKHSYFGEVAELLLDRAIMRRYLGKISDALRDFSDSYSFVKQDIYPDIFLNQNLLLEYGDCLSRMDASHFQQALDLYNEAQTLNPDNSVSERRKARIFLFSGDPKSALPHVEASFAFAKRKVEKENERKAIEHFAWTFSLTGEIEKALEYQFRALEMSKMLESPLRELAKNYKYLGDYYLLGEEFKLAEDNYIKAQKHITDMLKNMRKNESEDEQEKIIQGPLNLGLATTYLFNPQMTSEAEKLLNESIIISDEIQDSTTRGIAFMRFGQIHLVRGAFKEAKKRFEDAQRIFLNAGLTKIKDQNYCNPYLISELYIHLAKLELLLENQKEAIDNYDEAIELSQHFNLGGLLINAKLGKEFVHMLYGSIPYFNSVQNFTTIMERTEGISSYLTTSCLRQIQQNIIILSNKDKIKAIKITEAILNEFSEKNFFQQKTKEKTVGINSFITNLNQHLSKWTV